jgi:hypothetical protein
MILFMIDELNSNNMEGVDPLLLDLSTLRTATANFNESNKIGEGGFGTVYKVRNFNQFLINYLCFTTII